MEPLRIIVVLNNALRAAMARVTNMPNIFQMREPLVEEMPLMPLARAMEDEIESDLRDVVPMWSGS
jgi:hypothetical protein